MKEDSRDVERVFREEYGRAVSVLVRAFGDIDVAEDGCAGGLRHRVGALGGRGITSEPGRVDHHHGTKPDHRPRATRVVAGRPSGPGRAPPSTRRAGRGILGARRPSPLDLYVLPPGAGAGGPGRADAAPPRRAHDARDRPRLRPPGADNRAAHRPGQGKDPRRRHPLPRPEQRRAAGPSSASVGRHLSHLQRGVCGQRRGRVGARGPVQRSHASRKGPHDADARRTRSHRSPRAHAADRLAATALVPTARVRWSRCGTRTAASGTRN